jgi:hypothetical protein
MWTADNALYLRGFFCNLFPAQNKYGEYAVGRNIGVERVNSIIF